MLACWDTGLLLGPEMLFDGMAYEKAFGSFAFLLVWDWLLDSLFRSERSHCSSIENVPMVSMLMQTNRV